MARRRRAGIPPNTPEPAVAGGPGSARARLRLAAVGVLALLGTLWAILGLRLYLAPPTGMASSFASVVGLAYLVGALAYGLAARWVAVRNRWGHIAAIVVVAVNVVLGITSQMAWLEWALLGVNLVTLTLLVLTVPRRR